MADIAASVLAKLKNKAKASGISTQITGYIKNVRVPFNVDIGVGDVIVPNAQLIPSRAGCWSTAARTSLCGALWKASLLSSLPDLFSQLFLF